jgi:hypothetical protein
MFYHPCIFYARAQIMNPPPLHNFPHLPVVSILLRTLFVTFPQTPSTGTVGVTKQFHTHVKQKFM